MSGHSHYSTIKRTKEARDAKRGMIFSKLSKAISAAVKTGGGDDPEQNAKLRVVIEQAKSANMPKANIERAVSRAGGEGSLEEVVYEGYGPGGIGVVVETATDNKNRTGQVIKNLFERVGGSLAGPGAVSFNFIKKGLVVVKKEPDPDSQMLELIDLGVEDVEETEDGIEVYVAPSKLTEAKAGLEKQNQTVTSVSMIQKPKTFLVLADPTKAAKALTFLESLENHDDVQNVSANLDIPPEVLKEIKNK